MTVNYHHLPQSITYNIQIDQNKLHLTYYKIKNVNYCRGKARIKQRMICLLDNKVRKTGLNLCMP